MGGHAGVTKTVARIWLILLAQDAA